MLGGGGATGLLNEGGGEQQASCLVAKQAVEFPQVYTSSGNNCTRNRLNCTRLRLVQLAVAHAIIPELHSKACDYLY